MDSYAGYPGLREALTSVVPHLKEHPWVADARVLSWPAIGIWLRPEYKEQALEQGVIPGLDLHAILNEFVARHSSMPWRGAIVWGGWNEEGDVQIDFVIK